MKNRCRTLVLTLILATMIASGCSDPAPLQTSAPQTAEQPAKATTAGDTSDGGDSETKDAADEAKENELARNEAQKYLNALKDAFHEYANPSFSLSDELEAGNFDNAAKALDDMEEALKKIENIEAPEKYAPNHTMLSSSLNSEYDYINLCRKFIGFCQKKDSLTEDDEIEVNAITEEMKLMESTFPDVYIELVKTVKADIDKLSDGQE